MGTGRNISTGSQVVKVAFDFLFPHLIGVAFLIEEDELTYPVDVSLFGSVTEMLLPAGNSNQIKKTGFTRFSWVTP